MPGGFSEFLVSLSRAERDALLRSDAEVGTKNWLRNLTNPELEALGAAIFYYRVGRDQIGAAVEMQKHNEYDAAEFLVWDTLIGGRFDMVNAMATDNHGLSSAGFLSWVAAYMADPNKALTVKRLLADSSPDKVAGLLAVKRLSRVLGLSRNFSDEINQFITIVQGKGYNLPDDANLVDLNSDIVKIAELDAPLSIVTRTCAKCDGESIDYECVIQALEIVGGYSTLLAIRTPAENVISSSDFITSNRSVEIFENLLRTRANYYKRPIRSVCIADFLSSDG